MDESLKDDIKSLVIRAAKAHDAVQALNYSQAACNAANALRVLTEIEIATRPPQN